MFYVISFCNSFKLIIVFILFCIINNTIGYSQIDQIFENVEYPNYSDDQTIFESIEKSNSLWEKYKSETYQTIHVDYSNNRRIILNYYQSGKGERLTEFFEDSIAIATCYVDADTSYYFFSKYNSITGDFIYQEYWYPDNQKIEYYYFGNESILEKLVSITTQNDTIILKEVNVKDYKEHSSTKHFVKKGELWILKKEIESIN